MQAVAGTPPTKEPAPLRPAVEAALTFVPGDPPRTGSFFVYRTGRGPAEGLGSFPDELEVVVAGPGGRSARRRLVAARRLFVVDAVHCLSGLGLSGLGLSGLGFAELGPRVAGADAWAAVVAAGLGLIARGRLYPGLSPGGWDAWHAGPLEPADRRLLGELAGALCPEAHALALEGAPLRLVSPAVVIAKAWDALADAFVRTAGAPCLVEVAEPAFAGTAPVACGHLAGWLVEAAGGLAGEQGADVALRIELEPGAATSSLLPAGEEDDVAGEESGSAPSAGSHLFSARAVLQMTSRAEPSLVIDAADLYRAPGAVVARFGEQAEVDLLRSLRRGARAWPPFEQLLHERAPTSLELNDDRLAELAAEGANLFEGTGISLLWPAEILADGLSLRAAITPAPGVVTQAGFSLAELVEFSWQATLDGELLSEEEIDQLAEAKRTLVRLRGRFVAVDPALLATLRERRRRRLGAAEALGILLAGSVELDGESVPVVAEGGLGELADRLRLLAGAPTDELGAPAGLAGDVTLRPYQARGVSWLAAMAATGLGGCLADDMGLGKTLQVIALHLHRAASGAGPTLVVCPTSLIGNWEREVSRFAPGLAVRRHHGSGRSLADLAADELVVTSYGVVRRDADSLAAAGFSLVVADEAQHAKNHETSTARSLRAIGGSARIALTGTPVENRLAELWAILDWTTPGLLGPFQSFVRTVATPIEAGRDPRAAAERLASAIRPFVLRRRKTDPGVAPDLPQRIVSDIPVPLTSEQTTLYEAEVREALAAIAKKDGIARQGLVLRLLTVLKQICNHPAQYLHEKGPLAGRSGKLAALEELVDVIAAEGDSVLVFSQFVECLSLLEARLSQLSIPTLFLHGKVSARARTEIVDAFQDGRAPVLLLSLKVGGVGLNLTRATHVVHYDRWWNPAVEDQATDRAHRIGQDRTVQVHRLIAEGTLEDRIGELIEKKRALAEAVVGGGEAWIGGLSDDELADLVRLGTAS